MASCKDFRLLLSGGVGGVVMEWKVVLDSRESDCAVRQCVENYYCVGKNTE